MAGIIVIQSLVEDKAIVTAALAHKQPLGVALKYTY
jgi:hypothetical protein